ncbi:Ankyrin repeat-containing protein [Lachnellula willkommii]|uniref:Ankyrin repeat-containing protein n=1 Tax=Lachnellula willkommii TaxID=215461 RepID=A0A559MFS3_9HELO|nr:Ankyrin repeat-containing protein [Lachnellula willkommii]
MPTNVSEDEIDDLLYFARTGDTEEFNTVKEELCKRENITVVELLQAARDGQSGNGVLHMAAANGFEGLLKELCKTLSNPSPQNPAMLAILNAQNKAGNTALHWAALNGHLESVKVLLDQGADPTITNQRGHDPIYEAELNDKKDVVEWVLREGGDELEEGVSGETAEGAANEGADEDVEVGENNNGTNGEASTKLEEKLHQMDIQDTTPNS